MGCESLQTKWDWYLLLNTIRAQSMTLHCSLDIVQMLIYSTPLFIKGHLEFLF
jgi:hypothetical protein